MAQNQPIDRTTIQPSSDSISTLIARLKALPPSSQWQPPLLRHPPASRMPRPYYPVICDNCYAGHTAEKCNGQFPMQNAQYQ